MEKFKREITFLPAYDKRSDDPNKNYGIHGVEMRWILKGEKGAVQFLVYTNWYLPHVVEHLIGAKYSYQSSKIFSASKVSALFLPMAADVGYHSPKPFYEGQISMEDCPFLDSKLCYYDGSGLLAEEYFKVLTEEGDEAVWKKMEEYYVERFEEENEA